MEFPKPIGSILTDSVIVLTKIDSLRMNMEYLIDSNYFFPFLNQDLTKNFLHKKHKRTPFMKLGADS